MNTKPTTARRLRTVAGVVAVTVACSGGAYAAGAKITSSAQIKAGVVNTSDIKNGTVKVKDLHSKTLAEVAPKLEDWHTVDTAGEPQLGGSWTKFPVYQAPAFRKNADGVVTVRGAVTAGGDQGASQIFTLPAGYRPGGCGRFVVATTNGLGGESEYGAVTICQDGKVHMAAAGDDRFVSLENISFSVSGS